MKSLHCVYYKNRFADQYTLDLEGFMTTQEFAATINTFNTAAWHYPPPSPVTGLIHIYFIIVAIVIVSSVFVIIHRTHQTGLILTLPFSFLLISMIFVYQRRRQRSKFETVMIHLCSCMNATENVRGINFRLTFLTPEQQISVYPSSTYAITIEFDDRYNLLHHFSPYGTTAASTTTTNTTPPPAYYQTSTTSLAPPLYDGLTRPSNTYQPNEKL